TAGNPLRSRPSAPLAITTLAVVVVAVLLPYTPAARALGFEPLPAAFFAFLLAVVGAYLFFVELVKRHLLRRPAPG
ncbi:MAG TPA: cation transporting ATPase C-terminal domain-containing protein, partial [Thermoanaerobaculia bacterium]